MKELDMSSELAEVVDAGSLASFETVHKEVQVVPVRWSIEKHKTAEMLAISGKTKTAIAKELGIPLTAINSWLAHPDFKNYVDSIVTASAKEFHTELMSLKMKIVNARKAEAEINGYATLSNKDTLDVMAEIRKDSTTSDTASTSYTNLLEKLVVASVTKTNTYVVEDI